MKILLYGINFVPELTGIGKYTGEISAWLVGQGHEIRVVTAPYCPASAVGAGYNGGQLWRVVAVYPRGEKWIVRWKRYIRRTSRASCAVMAVAKQLGV